MNRRGAKTGFFPNLGGRGKTITDERKFAVEEGQDEAIVPWKEASSCRIKR
jgi:hypothetical protein